MKSREHVFDGLRLRRSREAADDFLGEIDCIAELSSAYEFLNLHFSFLSFLDIRILLDCAQLLAHLLGARVHRISGEKLLHGRQRRPPLVLLDVAAELGVERLRVGVGEDLVLARDARQ
jgi:hypothetical protein